MAEPHNHRTVGYSMIMVAASLVVIALLYLAIGDDVLYSDRVGKQKQFEYQQLLEESKQNIEQAGEQGKNLSLDLNEDIKMQNP
jgi:archaellum component FlaF (FlaF/FlaG flagellin family)